MVGITPFFLHGPSPQAYCPGNPGEGCLQVLQKAHRTPWQHPSLRWGAGAVGGSLLHASLWFLIAATAPLYPHVVDAAASLTCYPHTN